MTDTLTLSQMRMLALCGSCGLPLCRLPCELAETRKRNRMCMECRTAAGGVCGNPGCKVGKPSASPWWK